MDAVGHLGLRHGAEDELVCPQCRIAVKNSSLGCPGASTLRRGSPLGGASDCPSARVAVRAGRTLGTCERVGGRSRWALRGRPWRCCWPGDAASTAPRAARWAPRTPSQPIVRKRCPATASTPSWPGSTASCPPTIRIPSLCGSTVHRSARRCPYRGRSSRSSTPPPRWPNGPRERSTQRLRRWLPCGVSGRTPPEPNPRRPRWRPRCGWWATSGWRTGGSRRCSRSARRRPLICRRSPRAMRSIAWRASSTASVARRI